MPLLSLLAACSMFVPSLAFDRVAPKRADDPAPLVRLRGTEPFDPLIADAPTPLEPFLRSRTSSRLVLVQIDEQLRPGTHERLRELGFAPLGFLPDRCVVALRPRNVDPAALTLDPLIRWIGPLHPAHRVEAGLLEATAAGPVPTNVMVFDAERLRDVAVELSQLGAEVHTGRDGEVNAGHRLLRVSLDRAALTAALHLDEIAFIDRWSPVSADMNNVRSVSGAAFVESVAGYTGTGVRGEVLDLGFNLGHTEFDSNPLLLHGPVTADSHGASTSAIVFADGVLDRDARGLLPDGQGIVAQWSDDPLFDRYQHTSELVAAPYFASFQNASVGTGWTEDYTTITADLDAALFDFDVLHVQSQSNTGNQSSRPQAWAKNVLAVGGVHHFNNADPTDDCWGCTAGSAASHGPAADGRVKPDLCHFFDNIRTITSRNLDAYTSVFGGTSAASPIVAGLGGLIIEMWASGEFGNAVVPGATVFTNRPRAATTRALLINTARPYAFDDPMDDLARDRQGWGVPELTDLYEQRDQILVIDETTPISPFEVHSYEARVSTLPPQGFRATLVYSDPPALPFAAVHRINDLSLRVISPSGVEYWGNVGLDVGVWSVPGGAPNAIDTVENVFVENPELGCWTVEVLADEINLDGRPETTTLDADYALVVSGIDRAASSQLDCNCNGLGDGLEIIAGLASDLNDDGIPDDCQCETPLFVRGDLDYNGAVQIGDLVALLSWLYHGTPFPAPLAAADVDDDGTTRLFDPIYLAAFLFASGPPPASPYPEFGCDD